MDRLEEHEIGYLEGIVARYEWAYHDYYSNADVSVDVDDVKTLEKAIELIKAIPSAEPKWIPVSERLPEDDGLYLVYTEEQPFVCPFEDGEFFINDVLEWMLLPEPYKGGMNGKRK